MISVDEAVARIVAAFAVLEAETVPIADALGRVVAEDVRARLDQPPESVSAMDGYALRAEDAKSAPVTLRVIGEAPAGHPFSGSVARGETVRIFTGGIVPEGADSIVIQENVEANGQAATLREPAILGRHIRRAGLDFTKDDVLAPAGHRLRARDLALLAAGDVAEVPVRRRPRVALIATGDELSRPGALRKAGGIVASSTYTLSAMIRNWGGAPEDLGIFPDRIEAFQELPEKVRGFDAVVTMGGASVGDHDLVRHALAPQGFQLEFWKIAMRPGKPLIFGRLGAIPFFGLPGNPVSSFVCAILFLKPAISAMLGEHTTTHLRSARTARVLAANDARQDYIRARLAFRDGDWWAEPFDLQDSSMQRVFAAADGLIVRAPHAPVATVGAQVAVLPLDDV